MLRLIADVASWAPLQPCKCYSQLGIHGRTGLESCTWQGGDAAGVDLQHVGQQGKVGPAQLGVLQQLPIHEGHQYIQPRQHNLHSHVCSYCP